jgi:DNA-binding Lrp family transcriptional regulator
LEILCELFYPVPINTKPINPQNNRKSRGKTMKEILEIIESNPKIPPKDIATMTGLTEAQVASNIKEMEKNGIIRKYKTVIDWEKAGEEYVYAIIELKVVLRSRTGYDAIAERIAKFPEVVSVRLISGGHDLSLTVKGKSMKDVAFFVAEKIATLEQVQGTVTHFVLRTYKQDGDIMFEKEHSERLAVSP